MIINKSIINGLVIITLTIKFSILMFLYSEKIENSITNVFHNVLIQLKYKLSFYFQLHFILVKTAIIKVDVNMLILFLFLFE